MNTKYMVHQLSLVGMTSSGSVPGSLRRHTGGARDRGQVVDKISLTSGAEWCHAWGTLPRDLMEEAWGR